MLQDV
jgi:hypothetical protein